MFPVVYVFECDWVIPKELLRIKISLTLTKMIPNRLPVGELVLPPNAHGLHLLSPPHLIISDVLVALLPAFDRFVPALVFFLQMIILQHLQLLTLLMFLLLLHEAQLTPLHQTLL